MTGEEICKKALNIINSGEYVYWYGGKGEKCTENLLIKLAALYPSVYTYTYRDKCKKDIIDWKYCYDCSGLTSAVYGFPGLGTYGIVARTDIHQWGGAPQNGMILWKPSHCGIYYNGNVLEARGKDYGLTADRKYIKKDWGSVWYSDNVGYGNNKKDYTEIVKKIIRGDYGNGTERTKKLKKEGYTTAEIKNIQKLVNKKMSGG